MLKKLLLSCLLAIPTAIFADANDGQFMGYQLGDIYPKEPTDSELTASGNLSIVAEDATKPTSVDEVRLVTTPSSKTIGYIAASSWHDTEEEARASGRRFAEALRTLYPDWQFGRELMDGRFKIVEVNFDKPPYNLQLSLVPVRHDGRDMWRFSMGLGWLPDSKDFRAWQGQAASERAAAKSDDAANLLDNPEYRGL